MLKIHDLYGQSFAHEFQFSNPDSIRNAVKRYNMQRAAEREENKKDKETHKMVKMRFCKMRNSGNDVLGMVTSRDLDVETQMSLQLQCISSSVESIKRCSNSSTSSNAGDVQRLAGGAEATRSKPKKQHNSRKQQRGASKQQPKELDDPYGAHIAGLHRELCAELKEIAPSALKLPNKPKAKQQRKKQQQPKPKAEPELKKFEPSEQQEKILERLKQVLSVNEQPLSQEQSTAPMPQWMDIIPRPLPPQLNVMNAMNAMNTMNADFCRALDTTPSLACLFMQEHGLAMPMPGSISETLAEPQAPATFVEDSDLEQEYVDRPGYMRYIQRLPYPSNPSDVVLDTPCFVELAPHPNWIRLQRSLKPMHYTSQRSDTDTLTLCEVPEQPKVQAKPAGRAQPKTEKAKRRPLKRKQAVEEQAGVQRQPGGREKPTPTSLLPNTAAMTMAAMPQQLNVPKKRKPRAVVCTRSLENLKYQKMAIYNRISLMQERIITALDRLQGKLLQLQMPTCSNQEKQRRERNAFEFCVRFSRNFLYPLRGLIEDVRCTPVANFNSATSNEASQRVVCVYSLMHHSIRSYKRKLRYFLLDKVPQKLSALIEMMYTLTNVCLEKHVLDRQDPVVECLQQRCSSFITFIEDMQQERFQLARETYRRLQKHHYGSGRSAGKHDRYDLKMFLNDLKLYEPRLVPKERPEKRRPRPWLRRSKQHALVNGQATNSQSQPGNEAHNEQQSAGGGQLQLDPDDEVPTHIECVHCGDYRDPSSDYYEPSSDQKDQLSKILGLLQQPHYEKHELHQQLLKAMEHVTKSQVREVLDPLVRSLGAILDKKHH